MRLMRDFEILWTGGRKKSGIWVLLEVWPRPALFGGGQVGIPEGAAHCAPKIDLVPGAARSSVAKAGRQLLLGYGM